MPKPIHTVINRLLVCCFLAAIICSCSSTLNDELGPESNPESNPESLSLISNDLWISDAQKWTEKEIIKQTDYTLYSSLPDRDQEIEMHFDKDRNLFLIKPLNNNPFSNELYCEEGRIVFSKHINLSNGKEWLVAYANQKPYAAAFKEGDNWRGSRIENLDIDFNMIHASLNKALTYQKKEAAREYNYRIIEEQDLVTGIFESEISLSFSINVRKGEKLDVSLENAPRGIYFTIEPNNGSNMEHIEWNGNVDNTGDMTITVFTVESNPIQQFTLKTVVSNRRTQGYAQVL